MIRILDQWQEIERLRARIHRAERAEMCLAGLEADLRNALFAHDQRWRGYDLASSMWAADSAANANYDPSRNAALAPVLDEYDLFRTIFGQIL